MSKLFLNLLLLTCVKSYSSNEHDFTNIKHRPPLYAVCSRKRCFYHQECAVAFFLKETTVGPASSKIDCEHEEVRMSYGHRHLEDICLKKDCALCGKKLKA